ncbi:hypothetical protein ACQ86N_24485 [Puia sp. P3]|uniref:M61 family metallopeptidase n=1 Tax=Puia sp. P3 TaxID=3423952 RepID=UPI003D67FBBA
MLNGSAISFSFPNLAHHEARIELVVSDITARTATFRMSRSSPGRYATHEFGKNVYDVKAYDQNSKPLNIVRTDGDVYEVSRHSGYIRVQYTLYGNYADGTYVGLDADGAHLNMPGAFMWLKGVDNTPITIQLQRPARMALDNSHPATDHRRPTRPSRPATCNTLWTARPRSDRCATANGRSKTPTERATPLASPSTEPATTRPSPSSAKKSSASSASAQAVFGETPAYDYGSYTFLASINPYVHGDGMEHRNSTMISNAGNFNGNERILNTFAHEFFHLLECQTDPPPNARAVQFRKRAI